MLAKDVRPGDLVALETDDPLRLVVDADPETAVPPDGYRVCWRLVEGDGPQETVAPYAGVPVAAVRPDKRDAANLRAVHAGEWAVPVHGTGGAFTASGVSVWSEVCNYQAWGLVVVPAASPDAARLINLTPLGLAWVANYGELLPKLTPTGLDLLRACGRGDVVYSPPFIRSDGYYRRTDTRRRVNALARQLQKLRLADFEGGFGAADRPVTPTVLGAAVLAVRGLEG